MLFKLKKYTQIEKKDILISKKNNAAYNRNNTNYLQSNWSDFLQNPIHYSIIFNIEHIYLVVYQVIMHNEKYLV